MTYINNAADDSHGADMRDVPHEMARYTCDMDGETALSFIIPFDVKVCDVYNGTNQALTFYVSKTTDDGDNEATNLHTAGTSRKIETVATSASRPVVQQKEWNTIHFEAGSAATGLVTLRPAVGAQHNGLVANPELAALEPIA